MNPLLLKLRLPDFRVAGLGRALAVTTLLAAAEAAAAAAGWEELPPLPAPNGGQAAGAAGGKVIVVSGTNWEGGVKNWLKAVHEFDPARRAWRTRGNLEQAQAYSLAVESHGSLLVLGGSTGAGPFGGVARVDAHGASQSPQGGLATPAVLAAGGRIGHELFFVGGTDDAANVAGFRRDAFAWDLQTGRQRALEPYPGQGLGSAGGAAAGGELFVFGGARWDAENKAIVNLTAAYAYSPQTGKWRRLAPLPQAVRGLSVVAIDTGRLYLAGGYANDQFSAQGLIYDIATDRYLPAVALPYAAMVTLLPCGEYLYCLGGEDRAKHRSAAAYRIPLSAVAR